MKLHLGCGSHILSGWTNLDGQAGVGVDLVRDLHVRLNDVESGSCAWIYTSHVIEHVYPDKLAGVLADCWRMLEPGGKLTIATTDLDGIYRHRYLSADNGSAWESAMFGECSSYNHPMAAHRNCFTYAKLERLLMSVGFSAVRPWKTEDYPEIHALNDYARSCALVTCFAEGIK